MPANPVSPACDTCGLFKTHCGSTIHRAEMDTRTSSKTSPHRVLFVVPNPSPIAAHAGSLTADPGIGWMLDYLTDPSFTPEWHMTSALLCSPPFDEDGKILKVGDKMYKHCASHHLTDLIVQYAPHAIVCLGNEALISIWPSTRGKPPGITKARLCPIRLEELPNQPWLLASYNPRTHGWWMDSGGHRGQDLTEEYIRLFNLILSCTSGKFAVVKPEWKLIQTTAELRQLVNYVRDHGIRDLIMDVEDTCYLASAGQKIRPNAEDPKGLMPELLTAWHPDVELLCIGFSFLKGSNIETFVVSADPLYSDEEETFIELIRQMVTGRTISVWNAIYEVQDFFILLDQQLEKSSAIWDGWLKRGLRDQSLFDNGLKETGMDLCTVPDWQRDLNTWKTVVKAELTKKKLPSWPSMKDIPREVIYEYNAWDCYITAKLKYEHLEVEGYDYAQRAYDALIRGLSWLAEMERNGLPVNEDILNDTLEQLEDEERLLGSAIRQHPSVRRAEVASGREFNLRSPIFYRALIIDMYGELVNGQLQVPDYFPRTETGKPASDAETVGRMAGEEISNLVPWEEKTETQKLWTRIMQWREAGDDYNRLLGLLDYVVDGRIHPRYRGLRSEVADEDKLGGDVGGGAKSGRWSSSPNAQNLKNTKRFQRPFEAPPGWVWLRKDYGRIELAWMAWNVEDPLMMQWAREGKDAHYEKGAALWAVTFKTEPAEFAAQPKAVQDEWRGIGKTQNFATVYMEEARTTAAKTGIPYERVLADLRTADEVHPSIRAAKMRLYEICQNGGMIETCLLGRRRSAVGWIPSRQSAEDFTSLDEEKMRRRDQHNLAIFRSLWNTWAAQADATDTTFCIGTHIHYKLQSGTWLDPNLVKSVGFIHDSLDWLVWHEYEAIASAALEEEMQKLHLLPAHPRQFSLPIPVDGKRGYSLADFVKE